MQMWIRGDLYFWEDHITARITMRKYHIVFFFFHTTQCGNNLGKHSEIIYEFISSVLCKNYTQKKRFNIPLKDQVSFIFFIVFSVSFKVHTPFFFHFFILLYFIFYQVSILRSLCSWNPQQNLLFFFICSGFCHTLKWNSHGFTCVPHPDPPSHPPLYPLPLGLPSAPGPSTCLMHPTWAGDLFHPR